MQDAEGCLESKNRGVGTSWIALHYVTPRGFPRIATSLAQGPPYANGDRCTPFGRRTKQNIHFDIFRTLQQHRKLNLVLLTPM